MIPSKKTARLAGFFYLLMLVFGGFAEVVRQTLFVTGDMAATANNIVSNEFLYRFGIVSELIMMTCFVLLPLVLYKLLVSVNKNIAILMIIFAIVSVPINMLNLLNSYACLQLMSGAGYLNVFESSQLQAQAMLYHDMYLSGYEIASIFFGLWLVPFGFLVYKSGFLPRVLGFLLMIGGCGMFINVFAHFLFPSYQIVNTILLIPGTVAEISTILWLLVRAINESKIKAKELL
ncbi:MAG: DUF4386 domain-containing protein [Clostridia bacterium]|nr:DUF4386 domain-containing protein [Clostridia bacterium]